MKFLSTNRRLPARVATGTVIFIITPWTGNKPKFWICGGKWGISEPRASEGLGNVESWGPLVFLLQQEWETGLVVFTLGKCKPRTTLGRLQTQKDWKG